MKSPEESLSSSIIKLKKGEVYEDKINNTEQTKIK